MLPHLSPLAFVLQPSSSSPPARLRLQLLSIRELPLAPRLNSFLGLVEPFHSTVSTPLRSDQPRSFGGLSNALVRAFN